MHVPRSKRPVVAIVAVVSLLSTVAALPLSQNQEVVQRDQPVTLLANRDPLSQSIADDLLETAKRARVRLDRTDLDSANAFLDALMASRAELVIVVAHGDDKTGLTVAGEAIPRERILRAVEASRAKAVFFAACDVELPSRVGETSVRAFADDVDARVATLYAIEAWSQLYSDRDVIRAGFLPAFNELLARYGGDAGFATRSLWPEEPLHHDATSDRGWSWYARNQCYRPETANDELRCDKQTEQDDERIHKQAKTGTGGESRPLWSLTAPLDSLVAYGVLDKVTGRHFNKDWRFAYVFGKWPAGTSNCQPVIGLMDLVVPGYTINQEKLSMFASRSGAVQGEIEFDVLRLDLCGAAYAGLLQNGNAGGGGSLAAQLGHPHAYHFTIGKWWWSVTVKVESWVGLVATLDLSASVRDDGSVVLALEAYLDFVAHGSIGWKSGAFTKRLWGPFHRSWTLNAATGEPEGAQSSTDPADWARHGTERAIALALSEGHLASLRDQPAAAGALENRLGRPLHEIPPGSVVDLADPVFHKLFVGEGEPLSTELRIANGAAIGTFSQPTVAGLQVRDLASCAPTLTLAVVASCVGNAPAQTASGSEKSCIDATTKAGACVESNEGVPSGARLHAEDPAILYSPTAWKHLNETYNATDPDPGHWCDGVEETVSPWGLGNTLSFLCREYRVATAGAAIAPDHLDNLHVATTVLAVDANKDAWSVAIDLCPPSGIVGACDSGAGGAAGVADQTLYDTVTWADKQLTQWYTQADGAVGLFCGAYNWAKALIEGETDCPV